WNLDILMQVLNGIRFAHSRGIIHRDLKPSNVMLGKHGEVYVLDWGLARILAEPDAKDVRIRDEVAEATTQLASERHDLAGAERGSPLVTMDGDVVGTPAYMAPEQALGAMEAVGPHSDVYSVGAMLYHALAGHMPFVPLGAKGSPHAILRWVREVPPAPLRQVAPHAPAELVAICEKAMAREPRDRYPTMEALRDDLRAYLENRVVRAYRTGAAAELRKWVGRNRGVAGALAALILVTTAAGFAVATVEKRRASAAAREAEEALAATLVAEAPDQWPSRPERIREIRDWLARAQGVVARKGDHERDLEAVRRRGHATGGAVASITPPRAGFLTLEEEQRETTAAADKAVADAATLRDAAAEEEAGTPERRRWERASQAVEEEETRLRRRADALRREIDARPSWAFEDEDDARAHDRATRLLVRIDKLLTGEACSIADIAARLEMAESLRRDAEGPSADWQRAIASVSSRAECPRYEGRSIRPQYGLEPLRRDPKSGLWEFWLPLTGSKPPVDDDGNVKMLGESAIVLVLIPGGTLTMGAQSSEPGELHYDPGADKGQGPVGRVRLAPYFLSKFEMTQGQWLRLTGNNPSKHFAGRREVTLAYPVEQVTWDPCVRALARAGLELPTEAQWEWAARAGSDLTWAIGSQPSALVGYANGADASLKRMGYPMETEKHDDGYATHAPVDAFLPNPFGLHNVFGNVKEWCKDWIDDEGYDPKDAETAPSDGLRGTQIAVKTAKAQRGGSFKSSFADLRVARRYSRAMDAASDDLGVRPARAVVE
ncbi:MAG TPA: bifunctional serine/threonine-protein kinase/formylglycine-generating enzyme family protein, partial [Planctomycetota bacterium]|nr:bifunctional serine/threonine-protein kinase/formylglycine-generating enzyme family protein [Planctomycetota bacterium]